MKNKRILCLVFSLLFTLALLTACSGGSGGVGDGTNYPTEDIHGYIAWAGGSIADGVMRTATEMAAEDLGVSIPLTNQSGASGSIAAQKVYSLEADGYTLLLTTEALALYGVLDLGDLDSTGFIPVALLAKGDAVLVVPADSPYDTYQDFIDDCLARPGEIRAATDGTGSLSYNSLALVEAVAGIDCSRETFAGADALLSALQSGGTEASVVDLLTAIQHMETGDIKALAAFSGERLVALPDIPTLAELDAGYRPYLKSWGTFYGVFVKEGTDDKIVGTLRDAFVKAMGEDAFRSFCDGLGLTFLGLAGPEAANYIKDWQSAAAWALYDAGAAASPADLGIGQPA